MKSAKKSLGVLLVAGLLLSVLTAPVEAKSLNAYIRDAIGIDLRVSDLKASNNFESIRSMQVRAANAVENGYAAGRLNQQEYLDLRNKLAEIAVKQQAYEAQGKIGSKDRLRQLSRLAEVELNAKKGSSNIFSSFVNKLFGK